MICLDLDRLADGGAPILGEQFRHKCDIERKQIPLYLFVLFISYLWLAVVPLSVSFSSVDSMFYSLLVFLTDLLITP